MEKQNQKVVSDKLKFIRDYVIKNKPKWNGESIIAIITSRLGCADGRINVFYSFSILDLYIMLDNLIDSVDAGDWDFQHVIIHVPGLGVGLECDGYVLTE